MPDSRSSVTEHAASVWNTSRSSQRASSPKIVFCISSPLLQRRLELVEEMRRNPGLINDALGEKDTVQKWVRGTRSPLIARKIIAHRETLPSKKRTAGDEDFGCHGRDAKHDDFMKHNCFLDSRNLTEVQHH